MSHKSPRSPYMTGLIDGWPFIFMIVPFGLLFGAVATEAGLDLFQTMAATVLVIAGASQFTAVSLLSEHAPTLIVVVTALAVNLRMALYSASLAPHLGKAPLWKRALAAYLLVDQAYALCALKFEQEKSWTVADKFAYEFGAMSLVAPVWYASTLLGALVGNAIPPEYGLDFAVPLTFLAMIAPLLRGLPHVIAAVTAVIVSLLLVSLPFSLNVLVGAGAGMMVGAFLDWRREVTPS